MSLMTLSLTDPSRRPPKWRQLRAELRQRARPSDEPKMLDDRPLSDAGLTRAEADYEVSESRAPPVSWPEARGEYQQSGNQRTAE